MAVAEHRVHLQDGVHWQQGEIQTLFAENGNLVEDQASGRDITEPRLAEQSLRESEARYRSILEDLTELIVRSRHDGKSPSSTKCSAGFTASAQLS